MKTVIQTHRHILLKLAKKQKRNSREILFNTWLTVWATDWITHFTAKIRNRQLKKRRNRNKQTFCVFSIGWYNVPSSKNINFENLEYAIIYPITINNFVILKCPLCNKLKDHSWICIYLSLCIHACLIVDLYLPEPLYTLAFLIMLQWDFHEY